MLDKSEKISYHKTYFKESGEFHDNEIYKSTNTIQHHIKTEA